MITRIVRMSFVPEETEKFLGIFNRSKEKIRQFPGCEYLALHQDHDHPNVYYTLSHWQSQKNLNHYRDSDLFQEVWSQVKPLFNDKVRAYSLEKVMEIA